MEIKLQSLRLENFAGLTYFFEPKGSNLSVYAENKTGKTRLFSAWRWVLFGKNAENKTDFDLRPLDKDNNNIKGLVVVAEAVVSFGDETHTFRRENHEKVVKKQITGFETRFFVDEVPKEKNEYEAYIAEILQEHTFKMLTDTSYFCEKVHHTKRREVLLALADDIATPKGFKKLMDNLNGRSIRDYKSVLDGQKKAYDKERKEINPRMDEINKGFGDLGNVETAPAKEKRDEERNVMAELDGRKAKLLETESEREGKVDTVNDLKLERLSLELKLKQGDPTKVQPLMAKKNTWEKKLADIESDRRVAWNSAKSAKNDLEDRQEDLKRCMDKLSLIRTEYMEIKNSTLDDKCHACGQDLPSGKIDVLKAEKDEKKKRLRNTGVRINKEVVAFKGSCTNLEKVVSGFREDGKKLDDSYRDMETAKAEAFVVLDKKIEDCKTGKEPTGDDEWKRLDEKVKAADAEVAESMADQMKALDEKREDSRLRLEDLNRVLNNIDRFEADKKRLEVLGDRERELAQLIADVEKLLADIDDYHAEESNLIAMAVNSKFKHVKFKLFNILLNGSIEPTCEAMLGGTPYRGMSTGERIFVGVDIINALSRHYKTSVVLFIDKSESLTLDIETDAQIIRLVAEKGTKKLTVK